jgi:hypothetical protein
MNSSNFRFVLDLHSTQSQISIPVTKGDTARVWYISLSDGGLPYIIEDGCLAKIEIKRPTGTFLEAFCPIEKNTTVKYDFSQDEITQNTAAVDGVHDCSVMIYDAEGHKVGSAKFSMVVSNRVIDSDDINLTDEDLTAIDGMIAAEASRQEAETGRVNAEAERQTNEDVRQETLGQLDAAIKLIDDKIAEMEKRAEDGEFDGADGKDGADGTDGVDGADGTLADYRIKTSLNTTDYKLTVSLTDTKGNVVNSDTVDFPIESVVVGGDEQDGIVTLTLQNGNKITFEIGDLVDGLATSKEVDDKIANAITTTLNTEV